MTVRLDDHIEEAFDEIDAAVFSGDRFHNKDSIKRIEFFIDRWRREIKNIKDHILEDE